VKEGSQKEFVKAARNSTVKLLRYVLFQSGFLVRMAQQSKRSVILMFHGIPKESTEEFHDLLRFLAKHFAIVPLETVINRVSRNGGQKSMILALTFDDGLRNHRTVVYPLLADLRLPATFYVCPGLIGRAVTTWTWEFCCRIPWLPEANRRELCRRAGIRHSTDGVAIIEWMKTIPLKKRTQVEEKIRLQTPGFAFTDAQLELYELMSWADLAGVDPSLINVGSHTMTHCDLPLLNSEELKEELESSRVVLERRLGRPVHDFCYPDGKHTDAVVLAVADVYRSGVTTACGSVTAGDRPHALKRIGANPDLQWVTWLLATHTDPFHQC
jgi:peptidoglycan/xylan/chitin deacetylase (PgdA/CDA1 family)